jgi:hypothetical protein
LGQIKGINIISKENLKTIKATVLFALSLAGDSVLPVHGHISQLSITTMKCLWQLIYRSDLFHSQFWKFQSRIRQSYYFGPLLRMLSINGREHVSKFDALHY